MESITLVIIELERKVRFCLIILCLVGLQQSVFAQIPLEGGKNIVNYDKLRYTKYSKEATAKITSNRAKHNQDIILTVENTVKPDFIYNFSTKIPLLPTKIENGEIIFISFQAKTDHSLLETGEARCLWVLKFSKNPKEKILNTQSISSEWQHYYLPFKIDKNTNLEDLSLTLQFGFPPQKFQIKNLAVRIFNNKTNIEDLPKTKIKYVGMEANAPWREAAKQRIEQIRKGDIELEFTCKGRPAKNLKVQLELKRHYFSWGAAINAKKMIQDEMQLKYFTRAFNLAVFENDMKIKFWGKPERKEQVLKTIDLLQAENIDIKGHVLIWPGFRHLTASFKNRKDNPEQVKKMMSKHLNDILSETKGMVSRWDVVNEAYTNRDLQEITGSEQILYDGFRALKKISPKVLRYTNEYGIISKGGLDKKKQQWYYDYIKRIDENTDGLVDGIGIQCHMGSDLTSPEKVYELLDFYAQLDKKISISEFTMDINDPKLRELYTRDFLTIIFSHPNVHEFLFWGYQWEKADIYTDDWKPGTLGKAFFDLVHGEWKTQLITTTDNHGHFHGRGFYGTYEYTYIEKNKVKKGTFEILPGRENKLRIELKR